jgi:hypothetical protein
VQVLGLVLPYVLDIKTLNVCSTLSQQSQQLVQDAVQLNLAALVKQLPAPASQQQEQLPGGDQAHGYLQGQNQILWLCRSAGLVAVNIPDNACAVLKALHQMWHTINTAHRETGEGQPSLCSHLGGICCPRFVFAVLAAVDARHSRLTCQRNLLQFILPTDNCKPVYAICRSFDYMLDVQVFMTEPACHTQSLAGMLHVLLLCFTPCNVTVLLGSACWFVCVLQSWDSCT